MIPLLKSSERAVRPNILGDLRFLSLVGQQSWQHLPNAVQARFSKYLQPGKSVVYKGYVSHARENLWGRMLAQVSLLVGGPLPLGVEPGMAATVVVSEDAAFQGQFWTRIYDRKVGFPQVICSSKRFEGETGLEEYLGFGIHMALKVSANEKGLYFHSHKYLLRLLGLELALPKLLSPGNLTISHIDVGAGEFDFVLELLHPVLGEMLYQKIRFHDEIDQ